MGLKKNSGVYTYLMESGVLENATPEEIQAARKKYWNEYHRLRQIKKRKKEKREIVIAFPADQINFIRSTAKAKSYKLHDYIRACVKADIEHSMVIPHQDMVAEILQAVRRCYNELDAIQAKEGKAWFALNRTYENVLTVIGSVETAINAQLKRPQSLKHHITEAVRTNPKALLEISEILHSYGYKVIDP